MRAPSQVRQAGRSQHVCGKRSASSLRIHKTNTTLKQCSLLRAGQNTDYIATLASKLGQPLSQWNLGWELPPTATTA